MNPTKKFLMLTTLSLLGISSLFTNPVLDNFVIVSKITHNVVVKQWNPHSSDSFTLNDENIEINGQITEEGKLLVCLGSLSDPLISSLIASRSAIELPVHEHTKYCIEFYHSNVEL